MSRTIDVRGRTIEEALRAAVAELASCDPDDVELQLRVPGLADTSGDIRLQLVMGDAASAEAAEQPDAEPTEPKDSSPAEAEPAEPDPDEADEAAGEAEAEAVEEEPQEGSSLAEDDAEGDGAAVTVEDLDQEADAAADFLEGLLDALDLPGDLRIRVHEDHAEVEMLEIGSGALIGRRGQTLEAIQELVRCALQRQFERRSRVKVDAEGYRARRLEKLLEKAEEAIEDARETGEPQRLEPMDVFERKAVHHLVAEQEGIVSRSQGREPARRVVIDVGDDE